MAKVSDGKSAGRKQSLTAKLAYDVTSYVRDHPGGPDTLIEVAGQDATSAYEDVGHSEDAREIMHPFLVGVVKDAKSDSANKKAEVHVVRRGASKEESSKQNLLSPRNELAIFAIGTVAAVWVARHANFANFPSNPFRSIFGSGHLQGGGFGSGFLLASFTCAAVGLMGFRYFNNETARRFGGDYTAYPAHIPASKTVVSTNRPAGVLKSQEYQKFTLTKKVELAKDIYRFVFALPDPSSVLGLPIGQHIAIRGSYDDEDGHQTVSRSYTPVSNNSDLGRLELVIRCYPDGKLTGNYLVNLKVGDEVEFRGPKGAMRYRKGMSKKIGMVAGGTGITPMFQLIRSICEDKTDRTEVSLVYANRSEDDILLRNQLDRFAKQNSNFQVHYMVDQASEGWQGGVGHVDKTVLQEKMPKAASDTKILLCGPPGLVNATKKSLGELGFEEPGAVAKMSDQIFCF